VSSWFSRLREALSGGDDVVTSVPALLRAAQEERTRIELVPLDAPAKGGILVTTVEKVREDDFVICQPAAADGGIRQVARFEQLQMSFSVATGRLTGKTENLGRIKFRAGDGGELYGYRLSLPRLLTVTDRRDELRVLLGKELCCEVKLQVLSRNGPILGLIEDISPSGARLRCRNGGDELRRDRPAHFEAELPHPIGVIQQVVRILSVDSEPNADEWIVRVLFDEKVTAIEEVVKRGRPRAA
jgi:hypothetical protein